MSQVYVSPLINMALFNCSICAVQALLSGGDKCSGEYCSKPTGGATCGRVDGEPIGTVCPTRSRRKASE